MLSVFTIRRVIPMNNTTSSNMTKTELNIPTETLMKVSVYAGIEHMAPEVFWRQAINYAIRHYEVAGAF